MAAIVQNFERFTPGKAIAPVTTGERATCKAIIFPWSKSNLVKLSQINAKNDKTLSGNASTDTNGNLNIPPNPIEIESDIIQCTINKNKSGSSGNFSLTLKRGKTTSKGKDTGNNINYLSLFNSTKIELNFIK